MAEISVHEGPIECVQEEPVGFRLLRGGAVVPVYALGVRVYETWLDESGQKWGRWNWRYL